VLWSAGTKTSICSVIKPKLNSALKQSGVNRRYKCQNKGSHNIITEHKPDNMLFMPL